MSEATGESKGRFEPKKAVQLDPPKDDPIALDHLSKCDGEIAPSCANVRLELIMDQGRTKGSQHMWRSRYVL